MENAVSDSPPSLIFAATKHAVLMNKLNDNLKTFSLIVIACSLFTMTVLQVLEQIDRYNEERSLPASPAPMAPSAPLVDPKMPKTTMLIDTLFDFGKINEGDTVNHIFMIRNTGANPLKISEARGSCGCTTPYWPKEPILPGQSAPMRVHFDSHAKPGHQTKTVTIQSNAVVNPMKITIQADVTPKS